MPEKRDVGVVGVGLMGMAVAKRLLECGYSQWIAGSSSHWS